jgi:hypothetical protein
MAVPFIFFLFLMPSAGQNPEKGKRLILKDGSYELAGKYEIRGDRVRYYSSERNAWEEMPASLVDWTATEQFAGQASRESSERVHQELERAGVERMDEEAHAPLVAPGIRLPSTDDVYLLDVFQNVPELSSLVQNGADLNKNTGKNILRGVINPIAGPKQTVELKGLHARIRAHVTSPSIFVPIDPGDPSIGYSSTTARDHLRIVRCRQKNGGRVVSSVDIAIYGKVKQKADYLEVKVEPISEFWVKITPITQLSAGEYALVEFDEKGRMNQFVWDFGVNPAAPANPAAERSGQEKNEPVLIQKAKKSSPSK